MRKFILITALVLASATAQAGAMRDLVLASNDEAAASEPSQTSVIPKTSEAPKISAAPQETPTVSEAPKAAEAPKAVDVPKAAEAPKPVETPKYVERPPVADTTTGAPKAERVKAVAEKDIQPLRADKPKRRHEPTEARVIYELHRHGIYW